MKQNFFALVILVSCLFATTHVYSSEVTFDPSAQFYDMNGNGVLSLWGVPEAGGNALQANPDYGWPTEASVISWYAVLLKAQEMGMVVTVGYDPNNYEIWYITKPR
jgi:hypothetical protein